MSETCGYCGRTFDPGSRPWFRVDVCVGGGDLETVLCSQACLTAYAVAGPLVDEGGRP